MHKLKAGGYFLATVFTILFSLGICTGSSSGNEEGDNSLDYAGKLVQYQLVGEYPADQISSLIMETYSGTGEDLSDLVATSTPVRAYRIEYLTTNLDESLITVSGLMAVPFPADGVYPVVQYHHGTQFNNEDVPSNPVRSHEAPPIMALFAGHGYVASMPDYIGQGVSKVLQPYLHANSEATSSADMLKAVKELCDLLGIKLNSKLFITGLSHGGHATMALQRYLETTDAEQPFVLTASVPIAGPYHLPMLWDFLLEKAPPGCSPLAVHLILAYKEIYEMDDPLNDIFKSPYDSQVLTIDNGTYNGDEMYQMLPTTLQGLCQEGFLQKVDGGAHPFYLGMEENNTYDFVPVTPTKLFHAISDELVPYSMSELTFNYMIANGAKDLELVNTGTNVGHVGSFFPSTLRAKRWFDTFSSCPRGGSLTTGDLNGDGLDDLIGTTSTGDIWYTLDFSTWQQIPGNLCQVAAGDFDGDGKADVIGLSSNGGIYFTLDLSNWQTIPGVLKQITTGDFNGDGSADVAGVSPDGSIFYALDHTWQIIPGNLEQLTAGYDSGTGHYYLAGVASDHSIYYTRDLVNWIFYPGQLVQLTAGDFIGIGFDTLAGVTGEGMIFFDPDALGFLPIPGRLKLIAAGDFNGNGLAGLAGLTENGEIYYTDDLTYYPQVSWQHLPGKF